MSKLTVEELKKWLKIDYPDDDNEVIALISSSSAMITKATGCTFDIVSKFGEDAIEIYKLTQIRISNNLYDGNEEIEDSFVLSMYISLECYYLRDLYRNLS